MSRYKGDRFNYSDMSERITFQEQNPDGTYTDNTTVWAHILKDGFTRSETDNWFKIMVRASKSLESFLNVGYRIKWKKTTFSIFSWQTPSYEDKKFIEIMVKQIVTTTGEPYPGPTDNVFFGDVVSVYRLQKVAVTQFGLTSYQYKYDFTTPTLTDIKCHFISDRNIFLYDKKTDVEHDSLVVHFNLDAPIQTEDYIESPVHGRFKIDMITKTTDNKLEARVQRSEVQ
ncbi:MAG TPA: hypothetical protein VK190_04410 [Pseudoneobacillus sp.]|nr:hypothetical protein [Pseudoneobacillus sp.]